MPGEDSGFGMKRAASMNILQLKLFVSVAQTRSFTKTASEFYMTQPTVTNNIKALENSVGVKLLSRDSRRVELTPEGQAFIEYADRMIAIQAQAENRLKNISKGRSGYIRIAILSSAAELFSKCLTEYTGNSPEVQVDVFKLEGVEMAKAANRHDYDIYFANLYMIPQNTDVRYIVTGVDQLQLYVNKSIADKIDLSDWSTMQSHRFASVSEMDFALSGQIKNICSKRGLEPDTINYFNQADALLLAVNAGIGMAILPPGLTYFYHLPNIVSIPISGDDATVKSVVAWHEELPYTNLDVDDFLSVSALTQFR